MAINRVELKDFLVFNGEFTVDFCPGVNVIIGGNGTGKTTLMKYMYWHKLHYQYRDWETNHLSRNHFIGLEHYFNNIDIEYARNIPVGDYLVDGDNTELVFIPVTEMLSHSKSFLALCNERVMPFDRTQIDILSKAELGETHKISVNASKLLDKIKDIIGGEVEYDNDTFYVVKSNGRKTPFSLEASGFRKFGLLWKLLRNGLLESGTVLFWDEPEASINPELIPVLVDILLELQRGGVQVFIATHSEILASYFAVNRKNDNEVMFYSLYKDGEQIRYDKSDRFDLLTPNTLTTEQVNLYEREIERGLGNGS